MPHPPPHRSDLRWEFLRWFLGLSILAALVWLPRTSALFYALCAGSHIERADADLNHDGYVSVTEAGYACNVDSRPTRHDGHDCVEYYNRRDWTTVKEVCEP